ncbi:hypothetical protein HHI36_008394 [Cryptolaemus montrouzieri]|uniref:Uncharacterized protein n=1 Tax=Cryptolaemus montrouzieri TaxID=559131 RepID=A0ABD2MSW5_9CUCU
MKESQSIAYLNAVPYHNSKMNNEKSRIRIIGDQYAQKFRSVLGYGFVNARVWGREDIERGRIESNSQASILHEETLDPIVNPTGGCLIRLPLALLGSDHVDINGVMDVCCGQEHVNNRSLHEEMKESQSIAYLNAVLYQNSKMNNEKSRIRIIGDQYAQKFKSVQGLVINKSCYRLESFIRDHMDTADMDPYTGKTFEPHLSDHRAQVLELSQVNWKIKTYIEKYDINRKIIDKFISDVRTINWTEVTSEWDAGKAYEKFHSAIHKSFNKSFPEVRKRMKTNKRISSVSEASLGLRKADEAAHTI